ncbi:hypothetical protein R5R35_001310 [Gryllus longicercus]|uniref:Uncharacterized protein n=1 Tax=Gryllus longicercus TaxID=2509291 RepID=A0AAN9Z9J4_9ORTH
MPKSSILKILADAVGSYSACAKLIIDHTYTAGMSELVIEDCTALAFILDKLIPVNENQYDRECQSTARMLISAIAACNHIPEAQTTLVCELQAALLHISAMPESVEKRTRTTNLSAIIKHIIQKYLRFVKQPQTPSMKLHQYRLLGPGNHDLSITTNQAGYRDATRVVVMDNGMGLFANTNSEEGQIDFVDQSEYLLGPSLTATRGNIPTALWWWCEEGKLLDGDSQPDCVVANASKVIEVLEITKAEEIALRRERFRKRMEEEESKPRKTKKKISTEGAEIRAAHQPAAG